MCTADSDTKPKGGMAMQFTSKISKDIPVPEVKKPRKHKMIYALEVGESVWGEGGSNSDLNNIRSVCSVIGNKNSKRFVVRRSSENGVPGVRVWRIA